MQPLSTILNNSVYIHNPDLTSLFMRSIYVDKISAGVDDGDSKFQFYTKSKKNLAEGGFSLCKFVASLTIT